MRAIGFALGLLLVLPFTGLLVADLIHVPGDQPTIQAGIDAATNGDTVLLADGTYSGPGNRDLDFCGKAITVASANGPASCIVDCQGTGRGFHFHSGECSLSVLQGITVGNGSAENEQGGGIRCDTGSSPIIRGCAVRRCDGSGIACYDGAAPLIEDCFVSSNYSGAFLARGGGISSWDSSPTITGCTITENRCSHGGGVFCVGGAPLIGSCWVSDNHAYFYGGIYVESCSLGCRIYDTVVSGNTSEDICGGIGCYASQLTMENVLIFGNFAGDNGGGLVVHSYCTSRSACSLTACTIADNATSRWGGGCYVFGNSTLSASDSIIWGNTAEHNGNQFYLGYPPGHLHLQFSDVQGGVAEMAIAVGSTVDWGPGMITDDPLFVDGPAGGYCLAQIGAGQPSNSPCLDAGSNLAADICFDWRPYGTVCLDQLTTGTDSLADMDTADMGYHHALEPTATLAVLLDCVPASGTVPFHSQFWVELENRTALTRRLAGRIDVEVAAGQFYTNWSSGYTNLGPGSSFLTNWNQLIPALGPVIGQNVFTLRGADITPSPYNQPPYPASGDTGVSACTVTASAP